MITKLWSKTLAFRRGLYRGLTPLIVRRVVGHSMSPNLEPGWVLLALRTKRIAFGDVVIASSEVGEIVKRVVEVKKNKVNLAGDSHGTDGSHEAGWVSNTDIIARVVWPRV